MNRICVCFRQNIKLFLTIYKSTGIFCRASTASGHLLRTRLHIPGKQISPASRHIPPHTVAYPRQAGKQGSTDSISRLNHIQVHRHFLQGINGKRSSPPDTVAYPRQADLPGKQASSPAHGCISPASRQAGIYGQHIPVEPYTSPQAFSSPPHTVASRRQAGIFPHVHEPTSKLENAECSSIVLKKL